MCEGCEGPVRVDTLTKYASKVLCGGAASFRTVFGQTCRVGRQEISCNWPIKEVLSYCMKSLLNYVLRYPGVGITKDLILQKL